jgi:hypothetical protein
MLDLSGVEGGGTLGQSDAEQERSYLAASSGKTKRIRPGRLKARGAREEVRGVHSTWEGVQHNALEGRGPALIELGEGVSARACW